MKKRTRADLANAWLRKAASDLATVEACLAAGRGLDAACFHCQQAAEKALKAFLIARDQDFPHTHDLQRLVALCAKVEAGFRRLQTAAQRLNPYAVDFRYEPDFWPDDRLVRSLFADARRMVDFSSHQIAAQPIQKPEP